MDSLSPETIRKILTYDPETGRLVWNSRPREMFKTQLAFKTWNASWANSDAFTTRHCAGYMQGTIFNKVFLAHRICWAIFYGAWPSGQIDHINGNRSDNSIANLRDTDNAGNGKNQKTPITNSSGVIGVTWSKASAKWEARIKVNRKSKHLGLFDNLADAALARKAAEKKYGFHENHGRNQ